MIFRLTVRKKLPGHWVRATSTCRFDSLATKFERGKVASLLYEHVVQIRERQGGIWVRLIEPTRLTDRELLEVSFEDAGITIERTDQHGEQQR